MNKFILIIGLILVAEFYPAQTLWQINKDTLITWHYQDGDEFNDSVINTVYWKYWYGWARSIHFQKEAQYYTNGNNMELKNGRLNIVAIRERITEKLVDWLPANDTIKTNNHFDGLNKRTFDYTSGMLQTNKEYKYGYFEIKFKMPKEKGYWPAFWLYGGLPNEEIDWMELKTEKVNAIHVGRMSQKPNENRIKTFFRKRLWGGWIYAKANLAAGDNIISGEWDSNYIKYYLNGECIAYTKVNLNTSKVLCVNLAVPTKNGPYHPGPDTNIIKSSNYEIDYIRTWTNETPIEKEKMPNQFKKEAIVEQPIMTSKLKSKTKFYYGKKSEHKNEGVVVSVFPETNSSYSLRVLGKTIPPSASYSLINNDGKILLTQPLSYGNTVINLNDYQAEKLTLTVTVYDKQITKVLSK